MKVWKIIKCDKKTSALKKFTFGCMKGLYAINITSGCIHDCIYCYAKSYSNSPPPYSVYLYKNIQTMLEKDLDSLIRRSRSIYVIFNTASDSFQPAAEILEITYKAMRILIERNIPFSFLTKGNIPEDFIGLFRLKPHLIHARIGIVSLSDYYHDVFEPNTSTPYERLKNIKMLKEAGIDVEVRIDPIIPSVTDSFFEIKRLVSVLNEHGVKKISISCLHLRPNIIYEMRSKLGKRELTRILSYFVDEPWREVCTSKKTKLVPFTKRKSIYGFIKDISRHSGIEAHICICKNPDFDGEPCNALPQKFLIAEKDPLQPLLPGFFNTLLQAES